MNNNLHFIQKVALEISCMQETEAFYLQEETAEWTWNELLPKIRQVLDSIETGTEIHSLGRLEIEVTVQKKEEWQSEALKKIQRELYLKLFALPAGEEEKKVLSPETDFLEKLCFYLQNGFLPWNAGADRKELEQDGQEWLQKLAAGTPCPDLIRIIKQSRDARLRLVQTFPPLFLEKLLEKVFSVPVTDLRHDLEILSSVTGQVSQSRQSAGVSRFFNHLLSELLLLFAAEKEWFPREREQLRAFLRENFLDQLANPAFLSADFRLPVLRAIQEEISATPRRESSRHVEPEAETMKESSLAARTEPLTTDPDETPEETVAGRLETEGLYIRNTGLILLAPFIPAFFDRVRITSNGNLDDPGTALTALHYLVSSGEDPAEFELALPKVLCGLEIKKAVSLPLDLHPGIRTEAEELIRSVIEHWSVLKNTTPDGLRESFLQREGKLSFTQKNEWLLQVEQKPYDMLLRQLSWNIKMIKLPWMEHLLRTEWID